MKKRYRFRWRFFCGFYFFVETRYFAFTLIAIGREVSRPLLISILRPILRFI